MPADQRVLCVPSQNGLPALALQPQNQTSSVFSGLHSRGENDVLLCEPSQNGCDFERPHAHHQ